MRGAPARALYSLFNGFSKGNKVNVSANVIERSTAGPRCRQYVLVALDFGGFLCKLIDKFQFLEQSSFFLLFWKLFTSLVWMLKPKTYHLYDDEEATVGSRSNWTEIESDLLPLNEIIYLLETCWNVHEITGLLTLLSTLSFLVVDKRVDKQRAIVMRGKNYCRTIEGKHLWSKHKLLN